MLIFINWKKTIILIGLIIIIIKKTETTYKSSAYGFDKEPIELRILFHKLTEVYKDVTLKKDLTIDSK